MVVDHRTYTLKPGMVGKWLKKFEAEGLPLQEKHLGTLLGFFTTECGNLHQVVFMWRYESMADREQRRAAIVGVGQGICMSEVHLNHGIFFLA